MKFELNTYHRNISDEYLLQDIRTVATVLNKAIITIADYRKYGKYSHSVIQRRFGGWISACKNAGLSYTDSEISTWRYGSTPLSDEAIISDLQYVASYLSKATITTGDYKKHGNYDVTTILRKFKTWNQALHFAHLENSSNRNISDEEMLIDIERIWVKLGRQPTSTDIKNGDSKYSLHMYAARFGGWRGALEAFIEYINSDDAISVENGNLLQELQFVKSLACENNTDSGKHKTNRDPNLRLRFLVLKRDNFKCCACGTSPAKDPSIELNVDHIIPWSKGGETIIGNLQTLCQNCNLGKSDL